MHVNDLQHLAHMQVDTRVGTSQNDFSRFTWIETGFTTHPLCFLASRAKVVIYSSQNFFIVTKLTPGLSSPSPSFEISELLIAI